MAPAEIEKPSEAIAGDDPAAEATATAEQQAAEAAFQPFELVLELPARNLRFPPAVATASEDGTFRIAVAPSETLNDVRQTLTEHPESYWLGAFCFRWPSASGKNGKASPSEKVGEWVELAEVFKDVEGERRLVVSPVSFNEQDVRAHISRLRDLMSGPHPYDPSSMGVDAGLSVLDAIRNPEPATPPSSEVVQNKGKGKSAGKAGDETQEGDVAPKVFSEWTGWPKNPLSSLVPPQARTIQAPSPCLKHFALAPWSQPPHHLRLKGHLLYLSVITLEGDNVFITASSRGFWVNRSTPTAFDPSPRPSPRDFTSYSLFDLLSNLSPVFSTNFAKLFNDPVVQRDFFSVVPITNSLPSFPFLARQHPHTADLLRTQAAYLLTGATSADTLEGTRDWNDELQSTRELPHGNLNERVVRDRLLSRLHAEFATAAARAVPRVAAGEAVPMNPMDKPDAHMFIHANIFFSKGVDGVDIYKHMGGDEAAHVAVAKDILGIKTLNALDVDGICLLGHAVVDWAGERWVAQSVVPGLFRRREEDEMEREDGKEDAAAEDERAASANNVEEKKAEDGVKPIDLNDDNQVVYGGVEGPEVIRTDKAFHAHLGRVAKALHLAKHSVLDGTGEKHELWTSVDTKGLKGADGRKYVLDLARLTPVDVRWQEEDLEGTLFDGTLCKFEELKPQANGASDTADAQASEKPGSQEQKGSGDLAYPHRMLLLRPELLEIFWETELRKWMREQVVAKQKKGEERKKAEEEGKPVPEEEKEPEPEFELSFNPDAFVEFKSVPMSDLNGSTEEEEEEEERKSFPIIDDESDPSVKAVRDAGKFLANVLIPQLLGDVAAGGISISDGTSLTRQFHARGLNMRYLGRVAYLAANPHLVSELEPVIKASGPAAYSYLGAFRVVLLQEMALRAAKRILRSLLRGVDYASLPNVISHFLNCFLGTSVEANPTPVVETSGLSEDAEPAWAELTPESLRQRIETEVKRRFRFVLPEGYLTEKVKKPQMLRELCNRVGVQLKLQDYRFEAVEPVVVVQAAPASNPVLTDEDSQENTRSNSPVGGGASGSGGKNKKKKSAAKKKHTASSEPRERTTTFEPEDVLNIRPVVKESAAKSSIADDAFEAGRVSVARGDREVGLELLMEGISFHEQIYGIVHPEVGRAYASFANVLHQLYRAAASEAAEIQELYRRQTMREKAEAEGNKANGEAEQEDGGGARKVTAEDVEAAIAQANQYDMAKSVQYQRQAVTIFERTLGLDSPETLNHYVSLAVLELAAGNTEEALKCQMRVIELWNVLYGEGHPESATVLSNAGFILQHGRQFDESLKVYQTAHELILMAHGSDSIQTANSHSNLAQAYTLTGDIKAAISAEKEAWRIFEAKLGKDDAQTKEADQFLQSLLASGMRMAKMELAQKARDLRRANVNGLGGGGGGGAGGATSSVNGRARYASGSAAAAAAASLSGGGAGASLGATVTGGEADLSSRSVEELVKYIQGGGGAAAAGAGGAGASSSGSRKGKSKAGVRRKVTTTSRTH